VKELRKNEEKEGRIRHILGKNNRDEKRKRKKETERIEKINKKRKKA
jgi:hypothetical protein